MSHRLVLPVLVALASCASGAAAGARTETPERLWVEVRGIAVTELSLDSHGSFTQVVWFGDRLQDVRMGAIGERVWNDLGGDALFDLLQATASDGAGAQDRPQDEELLRIRLRTARGEGDATLPLPLAPPELTDLVELLRRHARSLPAPERPWSAVRVRPLRDVLGLDFDPPPGFLEERELEFLDGAGISGETRERIEELVRCAPRTLPLNETTRPRLTALLEANFLRWDARDFSVEVLRSSPG